MVYKNFILRSLISLIFLFFYFIISYYYYEYLFILIIFVYLVILFEIFFYFKKYKYIIILYLIISFLFTTQINFNSENIIFFNLMVLTIISFDVFSYIIGKLIGKNKIFKFISPNKTYEGLFGGLFFSSIFSFIYIFLFKDDFILINYLYIFMVIILSFLGDIIESTFKRINQIKNSSNLLPGHGGFFDRFDSFILNIIAYSFLYNYL